MILSALVGANVLGGRIVFGHDSVRDGEEIVGGGSVKGKEAGKLGMERVGVDVDVVIVRGKGWNDEGRRKSEGTVTVLWQLFI